MSSPSRASVSGWRSPSSSTRRSSASFSSPRRCGSSADSTGGRPGSSPGSSTGSGSAMPRTTTTRSVRTRPRRAWRAGEVAMSDNRPDVRRVGPGTRDGDTIVVHGWHWGNDEDRRPGLPWIGIFLVVFGALLILERFVPAFQLAGSAFVLAVGLVLLVRWAIERGTGSLYAGAIITALALPGTLEGLGVVAGPGLRKLCLRLAVPFFCGGP